MQFRFHTARSQSRKNCHFQSLHFVRASIIGLFAFRNPFRDHFRDRFRDRFRDHYRYHYRDHYRDQIVHHVEEILQHQQEEDSGVNYKESYEADREGRQETSGKEADREGRQETSGKEANREGRQETSGRQETQDFSKQEAFQGITSSQYCYVMGASATGA
jgi:hypothetical protein